MATFTICKAISAGILFCAAGVIAAPAQTFTTLLNFDGTDGSGPKRGSLVQGTDGNLYGTTLSGGSNSCGGPHHGCGTIFKITPVGVLTTLHAFNGTDGASPMGLMQASDGDIYGTTNTGGTGRETCFDGCGTVFKMTLSGTLTTLHNFNYVDGAYPEGTLIQGSNGNFYGTTFYFGHNNCGTIFKITAAGELNTLYNFCSQPNGGDGAFPAGGLLQAENGRLYGTTYEGGSANFGTIFEITSDNKLNTLYNFAGPDGYGPDGELIQASDRNIYGTTFGGGADNSCTNGCGTIFKITPSGTLTTLHSFGVTDGSLPQAALVQASDGNFYGTTSSGGVGAAGTVFRLAPGGVLTTLHSFMTTDGYGPSMGLIQATNGRLYGTTVLGGSSPKCSGGCGTIFSLSVGFPVR